MRAQADLPALGIALLVLTTIVVLGVTTATSALTAAERPALEERTAASLSDRLVAADASLTARENVLDADAVASLNGTTLHEKFGLPPDSEVAIRLDGEIVAAAGEPGDGTTVERIVLVERRTARTLVPDFDNSRTAVLPRRTSNITVTITPPPGTTVERVRANDRVVLDNSSGLDGTFEVALSPLATTRLTFETTGPLTAGSVRLRYAPPETKKAVLRVTLHV